MLNKRLQTLVSQPELNEIRKDVVIQSFKDRTNSDGIFTIRPLTSEEEGDLMKKCYRFDGKELKFDAHKMTILATIEGCVDPDFSNSEAIKIKKAGTPSGFLQKVLLPGEINFLYSEISKLSVYATGNINEEIEEIKKK